MESPFLSRPVSDHLVSNDLAFALRDIYPVSPGHALVVPRRMIATWFEATAQEQGAIFALVDEVKRLLDSSELRPDGYNVGFNAGEAAGQTVMHLHVHVIPRFRGDMDDPRGGVRLVIPSKGNYITRPASLTLGGTDDPLALHVLPLLERSMNVCILAAFVQESGLRRIRASLEAALLQGARVRLLTGDYLNITQASALETLLDWYAAWPEAEEGDPRKGVFEARIIEVENLPGSTRSFHPKAWHFEGPGFGIAFVGSSNLSYSALDTGIEWNLRVDRDRDSVAWNRVRSGYDELWRVARPIDTAWVEDYARRARQQNLPMPAGEEDAEPALLPPEPHAVQVEALAALVCTRKAGHRRALVVLATGLGKTWLAAFDWQQEWDRTGAPPRLLFLAHRREILLQALETFRHVVRHRKEPLRMGRFVEAERDLDADIVFASVAKLSREPWLTQLRQQKFDYVVVDEVHHAAADSYRRILAAMNPQFLLGLTATPDRADSADVCGLFNDNIAYQAGITSGIAIRRLVPFHYFGLADEVDYSAASVPWRNGRFDPAVLASAVQTEQRMQSLWKAWTDQPGKRTLVFCCSVAHADHAATWLHAKGVHIAKVYSAPGSDDRTWALRALASGDIDAICAIDVFNEGVDLPTIDRVVMLRPTESGVVFLQQLGRGLRKADDKAFLTVIDFVGNHRVFLDRLRTLVSLAATEPANLLRSLVERGQAELPGECSVELELEAKQLLEALFRVGGADAVESAYRDFRVVKGRRPLAGELHRMGYLPSALRRGHESWFGWVSSEDDLDKDERSAFLRERAFLNDLELRERMSKSFKMVTLEAMLEANAMRASIPIRDVALRCWQILRRDPDLLADVPKEEWLPDEPNEADVERWVAYWRRNPISAWTSTRKNQRTWFRVDEDRIMVNVAVDAALARLVGELVDYRLTTYRSRTGAMLSQGFTCRVTWNQRDPILKLPEVGRSKLPNGKIDVRLPDGSAWLFHFVKHFVNVARRAGSDRNELPDLLRRWFGPRAGRPGSAFEVRFVTTPDGWSIEPVQVDGQQGRDTRGRIVAYPDIRAAAGAAFETDMKLSTVRTTLPFDGDGEGLFAVRVKGDSMNGGAEPLRDGDWAVFRPCRGSALDSMIDRVVLVQHTSAEDGGGLQIKRLRRGKSGCLLVSDNPAGPTFEATAETVAIARLERAMRPDDIPLSGS